MKLQTVFVTNRNLNTGKDKKKRLFGNGITRNGEIHVARAEQRDKAEVKKYKIRIKGVSTL